MFNQILRISYGFAQHTKFCVIGGGTAGINLSAHLLRQKIRPGDIRIFEPSKYHYYQPGWTMVGNNLVDPETTRKLTSEMIPDGTQWTK
jgi:cation diffusion facilitator CzcD-associated flavoprotein CzcO